MTTSILIVFESAEGHTETVARRISERLESRDAAVTLSPVDTSPVPEDFDAIILGDSIHAGKHSEGLIRFAKANQELLRAAPSAAFQVSITSARDDTESTQVASDMMTEFCASTGLEPDRVGLFAGALTFSRYRGAERFLMQHVAREAGLDPDVHSDHSYTDWNAVDAFADSVLRLARRVPLPTAAAQPLVDFAPPLVTPHATLRDVADLLQTTPASAVLVRAQDFDPLCTESHAGVVGIVTERDVVEALDEAANIDDVWAVDAMSSNLITVPASASLEDMVRTLIDGNVRHLVVIEQGRVGIATSEGLLAGLSNRDRDLGPYP